MDQARRNELFYRVVTGEVNIRIGPNPYILIPPSISIRSAAEEIYRDCIEDTKFLDWLTDKQCVAVMVNLGFLKPTIDKDIEDAEKGVENCKMTLYDSFTKNFKVDQARKYLEIARSNHTKMYHTRHQYDYLTPEHYAETEKQRHILINTLYHKNGGRVWANEEDVDVLLLDSAANRLANSFPNMGELRDLARGEPWRPCWNIDKERILSRPSFELTDEQKVIINFSQRYDNAYQHPECPTDRVFEDDDLFDGWQLTQIRKHEKDKDVNELAARTPGKIGRAGEIFVIASDKDDAAKINSLNTTDAEATKRQRLNMVQKKGVVKEGEFLDSKLAIQRQSNEAFKKRK